MIMQICILPTVKKPFNLNKTIMKIITYPDLYKKYKNKTLATRNGYSGVVVGYFIDTDDSLVLFVQTDKKDIYGYFNYFITEYKIDIKDYHGDNSKCFFLANKKNFDRGHVKVVK